MCDKTANAKSSIIGQVHRDEVAEKQREYSRIELRQVDNGYVLDCNGWSAERGYYASTHVAKDKTEISVIVSQFGI